MTRYGINLCLTHTQRLWLISLRRPNAVFYTEEAFTKEESDVAQGSWELIMDDQSPQYVAIQSNPDKAAVFPHNSCKEWFSHEFYERLFDVHPYARPMFKDPKSQGNFLVALFSFIFTAFENPPVVSSSWIRITSLCR